MSSKICNISNKHYPNYHDLFSEQSGNGIINQVHRFNDYLDLYDKDADYIRTHTKLTGDNHILYHQKITGIMSLA